MKWLYLISIQFYGLAILVASLWNEKAGKFVRGRKRIFRNISETVGKDEKIIWMHCSSLGEYEQGKPLIKKLKTELPDHKIFLTLFSPSGYEHLKGKSESDYLFYLPLDSPVNARRLMKWLNPAMAIFIKYEYWYFYLHELNKRKIPVYVVSCLFRPDMRYFKWYGGFFKKMLNMIDHFFVQDEKSQSCLYNNQITHVTVSGDTRFDTVWERSLDIKPHATVQKFLNGEKFIVAGSTWPGDEILLNRYINEYPGKLKMIVAPHEITEQQLVSIEKLLKVSCIRFSQAEKNVDLSAIRVLIIDNIGMLSALYANAALSYIGGGFGKGIHNILEAAVFGSPIIFGPRYGNFREATDLVKLGGAFSIKDYRQLKKKCDELLSDDELLNNIRNINTAYVKKQKGASDVVTNFLLINKAPVDAQE